MSYFWVLVAIVVDAKTGEASSATVRTFEKMDDCFVVAEMIRRKTLETETGMLNKQIICVNSRLYTY